MAMTYNTAKLTVKEFLSTDKYVIPIYQRNYDWGEKETLQLIEDVADYASEHKQNGNNYYIGSAIVFPKLKNGDVIFETIDGQQRLTTLTILTSWLHHQKCAEWYKQPNLTYDHRKEADLALKTLGKQQSLMHSAAQNIENVYNIFENNVQRILKDKNLNIQVFADYLFNHVIVIRIPVPEDTDLNHYFEIMNTRGEQLEKHEVLKAKLMNYLNKENEKELSLFDTIWEACSDMSSYVQMNFSSKLRNVILDNNWENLRNDNFDDMLNGYIANDNPNNEGEDDNKPHSIRELLDDAKNNKSYALPTDGSQDEGKPDRFGSIVNFPNFLLHVLKVMYHSMDGKQDPVDEGIRLDDKRLIPIFQKVIDSFPSDESKRDFVKQFIMTLLALRLKFDRYVIKREYLNGNESWSLKRKEGDDYLNTFGNENKDIRMLEAMFHVSAPTQTYKHWLNAILYYLYDETSVESSQFRDMLYSLAKTYMLDVYLTKDKVKFENIIYENNLKNQNDSIKNYELINEGCKVPNFIFNFYDYITWKENPGKYPKFEFTYRTSVEHFYPQNPMPGYDSLEKEVLDNFGNLCLISHGMNSKFSNNMPKAKLDNFGLVEEIKNGLSLKLLEMMNIVKNGDWGVNEINDFEKKAKEKLSNAIYLCGQNNT